jgi:hypothetical protein
MRSLKRIERGEKDLPPEFARECYYLSLGLQGSFIAYFICSFFSSIQYDWYIYYPIAFAVGLRRIFQSEADPVTESLSARPEFGVPAEGRPNQGVLWQSPHVVRHRQAAEPSPAKLFQHPQGKLLGKPQITNGEDILSGS